MRSQPLASCHRAQEDAAFAKQLNDPQAEVRVAATMALGTSAEAVVQHGAAIAKRLEDSDWGVRWSAVEALAAGRCRPARDAWCGTHGDTLIHTHTTCRVHNSH